MRLKLRLHTRSTSADVVVTADATATVGEIATRLSAANGPATAALTTLRVSTPVGGSWNVPPQLPLADAPIASGSGVEVVPVSSTDAGPVRAVLRVIAGPDAGPEFPIRSEPLIIGRDASADIVLRDRLVSKRHARIEAGAAIELVDLNSANGILVDGGHVPRITLESGQVAQLGDDVVQVDLVADPGDARASRGPVRFVRSPRVEERYLGETYDGPVIPQQEEPVPFPWIALVAPLALGLVLVLFPAGGAAGAPTRFLFLALSPILMAGTFVTQILVRRRKRKLAVAQFEEQLTTLDETLTEQRVIEQRVRLAEAPSTQEVLAASRELSTLLWTRRPEHWSFLDVRLGTGTAPTRNEIKGLRGSAGIPEYRKRFEETAARFATVDGVPFVENLDYAGAIGVAGDVAAATRSAHALLVQLAGLYSPAEVVFGAILSTAYAQEFEWIKWLPHSASPLSPLPGTALADSTVSGTSVLMALEELIASRARSSRPTERGSSSSDDATMEKGARVGTSRSRRVETAIVPAVVLLVSADAPVDRARLISLTERAADAGVYPIWLAESVAQLPAACRTFVRVEAGVSTGELGFVREGERYPGVELERVDAATALDFARTLAGVTDAGAYVADASDMPRSVSLASLVGPEMLDDADAVVDRWRQNDSIADRSGAPMRARRAGRLRAIVGQSALDAMHLDLRSQGPHALVGGTTGSGKSEFLQSWVLGMAAEYSPDRVTFLFVDYKGGSAFADCVSLPHCVGLVTDLSPHLVRRALTSLRAELRHREHLFNQKRAKDLIELEKRGDPEAPPALVIVIDEFAALAGEVPEFVDGVVDVAQRGRSLGIHLIMATQRPAGVIKDNLRANTNLRIALRMADESDSQDVVGDKVAAGFDPSIPGRAIAKTGPGRLTPFQSAYAGGWTTAETAAPVIEVAELRFGAERVWETGAGEVAPVEENRGPTDQARLVRTAIAAARSAAIPEPRRPWLPELNSVFDATRLNQRVDTQLVLGVVDVPEEQRQEAVYFRPDVDGNLAIYGTGGSGKTVALRTLGAMAGVTPRSGPVVVYALDFAGNGLKMLEALPHVGSVVSGDDSERVVRLLRTLRDELDTRGETFAAVAAGTITDYRAQADRPDEPRILLLVDGYPAFRAEYETNSTLAPWYGVFQSLIGEGRQLGIHVALSADRPGSVPTAISSAIQRRVVLRLAEEQSYMLLDAPKDVLGPDSPPGRAIIDGREAQIAVVGGVTGVADQARALASVGESMIKAGRRPVAGIGALPAEYPASQLPPTVGAEQMVIGLSDEDLGPIGIEPVGPFIVSGPPGSGRSTALAWLRRSLLQARPDALTYYVGNARSRLGGEPGWTGAARSVETAAELARSLAAELTDDGPRRLVMIEGIGDFLSGPADSALVDLIKAVKRTGHFLIAESESSAWASSWPLLAEVKAGRSGIALQPETTEGDLVYRTPFPRIARGEFPPGRGLLVTRGRTVRVQLPLG